MQLNPISAILCDINVHYKIVMRIRVKLNKGRRVHSIPELIAQMKRDWTEPQEVPFEGLHPSPAYQCIFEEPATTEEIDRIRVDVPESLRCFWNQARSAELFRDIVYGQRGMRIMSPEEASMATDLFKQDQDRERDAVFGDLVIGEFFTDFDTFIIRCDQMAPDFGTILAGMPLDSRSDWQTVASDLTEFLNQFVRFKGDKYWEWS
ncbi:MAG: SMI1/KNR4 family protein [Planctomycetota bacterium]|nr:SMI1/KNR4 family protein [Planctomycetota bacterium]